MHDDLCLAYLISVPGLGRKTIARITEYIELNGIDYETFITERLLIDSDFKVNENIKITFTDFLKQYTLENFAEMLKNGGIRVVTQQHAEYPQLLLPLDDKPVLLFAKGAVFDQATLPIAVVGTRKITPYGKQATEHVVKNLVPYNSSIISGCMYGIDMQAHQVALTHGLPTAGILGFGFNHIYPKTFKKTFAELLEKGATLFTEFGPDVSPLPGNFPVRNRIVAGMSRATVVIEAALGSGSLITAQCALEYGRVVGAVAGPFNSEFSEGTKWLINQGAKLITHASDVVEELYDISLVKTQSASAKGTHESWRTNIQTSIEFVSETEKKVYEELVVSKDVDELSVALAISTVELSSILTNLELRGLIQRKGSLITRT